MKTVKIMKYILLIFISFSALSCSFLDEDVYTTVEVKDFYKTQAHIEAALVAAYATFQDKGIYDNLIFQVADVPTDMLNTRANNNVYNKFLVEKGNSQYRDFWESCWKANNAISSVITYAPNVEMDENIRSQILGEAKFLRALNYFNLVRVYGPVPLVLEPVSSVQENLTPKTVSRDLVYAQIIKDLQYAEENLAPLNIGRATSGAAKALLGKVYLTFAGWTINPANTDEKIKGEEDYYQLAADKLKEVIDSKAYDLFKEYADVFSNDTENGVEHIFSIQFKQGALAGAWGGEGSLKQTHFAPQDYAITHSAYETFRPTTAFYAKFADSDKRRSVAFLDKFTDPDGIERIYLKDKTGNLNRPYVKKYLRDVRDSLGNLTTASARDGEENTIVLRYADVLLMYSEAEFFANNSSLTQDILDDGINLVRFRAGLANLNVGDVSNDEFVEKLLDERDKELCFEGHGWFDYVRLGQLNERCKGVEVEGSTGAGTTTKFYYWPIPNKEIEKNENLEQSPGW